MQTLEARPILSEQDWNEYVLSLQPNTFLQSWEWGQLQQAVGEEARYLGLYDGSQQVGCASLLLVKAKRGYHWLCPHGPLVAGAADYSAAIDALIAYAKRNAQSGAAALRIAPLAESTPENNQLFKERGFRPAPIHVHAELTWVLDIAGTPEQILAGMRKTSRHAIKKADAGGVKVDIISGEAGLDRFMPLYKHTTQRHGFVPFSPDFLRKQLSIFSKENRFFTSIASHNGQDIASAILIHFGNTVFYYHGASIKAPEGVPAPHLLQWQSILEAKRRGAALYNFWGIARDDEPKHPFAGITTFKKGFGGYPIDYLHAQDLPLSSGYWKLWLVDSYRKWRRGF